MSAVDKCSLPNIANLMQPIHMQLSQTLKTSCSFIKISGGEVKFSTFSEKRWPS